MTAPEQHAQLLQAIADQADLELNRTEAGVTAAATEVTADEFWEVINGVVLRNLVRRHGPVRTLVRQRRLLDGLEAANPDAASAAGGVN